MADTYEFRLIFSGLCALRPNADIESRPSQVDFLLVDTDSIRQAEVAKLKLLPHDRHLAVLRFSEKDVRGRETENADVVWMLEKEQIAFEIKTRTGAGGSNPSPKRKLTIGDLSAVPRIDKVFPDGRFLDPEAEGPNPRKLIARLSITEGLVQHHKIGRYRESDVVAQFVPPPGSGVPVVQRLAFKVAVTLELNTDEEIVIHSKKFADGEGAADDFRTVTLGPVAVGKLIEVIAANVCCGDFMDIIELEDVPVPDRDFEFFYLLCKDFVALAGDFDRFPIPVPMLFPSKGAKGEGGGEPIRCNLALFNFVPSADDDGVL